MNEAKPSPAIPGLALCGACDGAGCAECAQTGFQIREPRNDEDFDNLQRFYQERP
jgi:hypothetical protein